MREHLLPDYASLRQGMADWLFEELPYKKADKSLNSVETPQSPAEEEYKEDALEEAQVWSEELGGWICGLA